MKQKNKRFYLIFSIIILTGLFFALNALPVFAAGCEKNQEKSYFFSYSNPLISFSQEMIKGFGYNIVLAANPDPDFCGSDSTGCSGDSPYITINWEAAPASPSYYILTLGGYAQHQTVSEGGTASLTCPGGTVIVSYSSIYGAICGGSCSVNCGSCSIGSNSCTVTYNNSNCGDCHYGCVKPGDLDIICGNESNTYNTGSSNSYTISSGLNNTTTYNWSIEAYYGGSSSAGLGYTGQPYGSLTTPGCCTPSCGSWSTCSVSCGGGTQSQTCISADCSTYTNTQTCNTQPCNDPPIVSNLSVINGNYCSSPSHHFSWKYSDPDSDNQSRFQFQADNNSNFSSPEIDRNYSGLSNPSPTTNNQTATVALSPGSDQLAYNTTYYWRVNVYDSNGADSGWVSGPSLTTEKHQYPSVDFNWSPEEPSEGEDILFADQSTVYGGAAKSAWSWTFENGNPSSSAEQNPVIQFTNSGDQEVVLEITDSDGYACSKSKTVNVQWTLPDWKEILPW